MNTDIFASNDEIFEIDPTKDYYSELVGDDKKYKDNQALALSRVHADATITQRERELAQLREELSTRLSLEQFLDKLNQNQAVSNLDLQTQDDNQQDKSAMSTEQMRQLVADRMLELESEKTATQNLNTVVSKLSEVYGPNYASKLRSQASELGMSEVEVKSLAARNPKVLFRLLGVDKDQKQDLFQTPIQTQVTSLPSGQKRGFNFYEKIRKSDPNTYFSPKIQNEMMDARKQLGADAFYQY